VTVGSTWLVAVVTEGIKRESTAAGRARELALHATRRMENNARILSRTEVLPALEQILQVGDILCCPPQDIESSLG
jgi:hypothetical protein